ITGAGGQLGAALREAFPDADARTRQELDVTAPLSVEADLVLHAAAWTDVDGAERDPASAEAVNVGGTRNVAALGAPVVYYSTDRRASGMSPRRASARGRSSRGRSSKRPVSTAASARSRPRS